MYLVEGDFHSSALLPPSHPCARTGTAEGQQGHHSSVFRQGGCGQACVLGLSASQAGAESFYRQASKVGEPKLQVRGKACPAIGASLKRAQVLDLSALIKKMRKGGSTE